MRRRRFIEALVAAPALAPVALAQAPVVLPQLKFAAPDVAAETVLKFFDARQFATLRRLSAVLEPRTGTAALGAVECGAPEFLDFLLDASPSGRQHMYLTGLDMLEYDAQVRFRKSFAATDDAQAGELLAGLRKRWTYTPPDTLTAFLREAKEDIRTATRNSEAWAKAGLPGAGGGQYWPPVE